MSRPTSQHERPAADAQQGDPAPRCPVCEGEAARSNEAFPFCSPRCRLIDLGRWLGGKYVVSRPLTDDDLTNQD